MIGNKSKQTAALITLKVQMDLTEKGWSVTRSEEEAPYDLIVDFGVDDSGKRELATIQVKKDLRTTSRPGGGKGEPVSSGGKDRNSYNYYDEDITYLATVKDDRVIYYHKDQYRYSTPSQLKKLNESVIPINQKIISYRKNNSTIKPIDIFEVSE
tara:strand:+ start:50 stop:514 length:465 start_codon:yes stop_codon:yes gene_type:complete